MPVHRVRGKSDCVRNIIARCELHRRNAVERIQLAAFAETAHRGSLRKPGVAERGIRLAHHVDDYRNLAAHPLRRLGDLHGVGDVRSLGARCVHAHESGTDRAAPHCPRSAKRLDPPLLHSEIKRRAKRLVRRSLVVVAHEDASLLGVDSAEDEAERKRLSLALFRPKSPEAVVTDNRTRRRAVDEAPSLHAGEEPCRRKRQGAN